MDSYAVFTYKCEELNWFENQAIIGFRVNNELFANHPLSQQQNVTEIDCVNEPQSPWSNVVYKITG